MPVFDTRVFRSEVAQRLGKPQLRPLRHPHTPFLAPVSDALVPPVPAETIF